METLREMDILPTQIAWGDKELEKKVYQYVTERLEASAEWDEPFKRSNLTDFRNLCSRSQDFGFGYSFQMFDPETQNAVNSTMEGTMGGAFSKDSFFDLRGVDGQNEIQIEKLRETMLRVNRRAKWKLRYFNWAHDAVSFGNGLIYTWPAPIWKKETLQKPIIMHGIPIGSETVKEDVMEVWPEFVNISRWDVYPYPGVGFPDIQEAPFFGFRRFMPLETVRRMANRPWAMWKNTDKLKGTYSFNRSSRTVSGADRDFESIYDRLNIGGYHINDKASSGSDCIKICEVFFYFEAPPGQPGCRAYAVKCEDELLACCGNELEHGWKPLADLKWMPFDATNLWQCWGVPAMIRPYQDRLNITLSQKYELRQKFLTPTRIVGPGFGVDPLTKLLAPTGSIIRSMGDITQIRDIDQQMPRPDLFSDEGGNQMGIQRATHLTDASQGMSTAMNKPSQRTAAGIAYLGDSSQRHIAFHVLFFEEGGVVFQLQQSAAIVQQTLKPNQFIPMSDTNETLKKAGIKDNQLRVSPDDIGGGFEFFAVGASKTMETPELADSAVEFYSLLKQDPEISMQIDWLEVAKKLHEWKFKRPLSTVLKSEEQLAKDIKETPPPLPVKVSANLKDMEPEPKAIAYMRMGLPPPKVPPLTAREAEVEETKRQEMKQAGETKRTVLQESAAIIKEEMKPKEESAEKKPDAA